MVKTATNGLLKTANDLSTDTRLSSVELLNQTLADLSDHYSQTKQAHWNVRGKYFYPLHKLFDELAAAVEQHLDTIAERVTALGGLARGTVRDAAANSQLDELPLERAEDQGFVGELVTRFSQCAASTRTGVDKAAEAGDTGTADLLTAVSRELDKSLWFLEAHQR